MVPFYFVTPGSDPLYLLITTGDEDMDKDGSIH